MEVWAGVRAGGYMKVWGEIRTERKHGGKKWENRSQETGRKVVGE